VTGREHLFTSREVQRLVGIAQHTLSYWDRSAVVHPRGMSAQGRGSRRLYTILDVVQLRVIRHLREAGISLQKIRRTFELVADWPDEPAPLAELEVITNGTQILVRRSDNSLVDVLSGQFILRLTLADLLAEVRNGVVPLPFIDSASRPLATVVEGQVQ
jgi:DNA-binding transcriptional MerR regulator